MASNAEYTKVSNGEAAPKDKGKKIKATEPFQIKPCPPWTVYLNPFAWLLWLLDFVIWLVFTCCYGPVMCLKWCIWDKGCKMFSVADEDAEEGTEEATTRRRYAKLWDEDPGLLELPFNSEEQNGPVCTIWELANRAFYEYAEYNALGTRKYLYKDSATGKAVFGETEWKTFEDVGTDVLAFGAGLRQLGMQPLPRGVKLESTAGPHTMLIFENTSAQWLTSLFGAHSQSLVVATSYATLGIQAVVDAIKECNIATIVCNRKDVDELKKVAPPVLKNIIYTNLNIDEAEAKVPIGATRSFGFGSMAPAKPSMGPSMGLSGGGGSQKVISFEEVIALGKAAMNVCPPVPPDPDQLAVIMYTSGSTGKPKGVMITHRNVMATCAAMEDCMPVSERDGEKCDTYLAYLPAAHIFEFCVEVSFFGLGAEIGYSDPKTFTSKGAIRKMPDGELHYQAGWPCPPGGLQEFSPTVMVAVPVVWDSFKKQIEEVMGEKSVVLRWAVQVAFSGMFFARKTGRFCPLLQLVFKSVAGMTGGRLKFGVSGGGPISGDVQSFMSIVGGFPLFQGYALTETCMAGCVQEITDYDTGNVGGPKSCLEMKLRTCDGVEDPKDPSGEYYTAADEEHMGTPCLGRGEICIRGPSVSLGYFKQPDKTAEAWDKDGWFRTGDIGYWDTKGRLVIVDRLKNLIKLKGGEYIAVENMEKEYSTSPYVRSGVSGGIMCYGDGDLRRAVALVQVNMDELKKWAQTAGLSSLTDEQLCSNEKAMKMVLDSLNKAAGGKLSKNEGLVAVGLVSGNGPPEQATPTSPWSPDNGCRTPSNKLDRKAIQKACAPLMDMLKKAGA